MSNRKKWVPAGGGGDPGAACGGDGKSAVAERTESKSMSAASTVVLVSAPEEKAVSEATESGEPARGEDLREPAGKERGSGHE